MINVDPLRYFYIISLFLFIYLIHETLSIYNSLQAHYKIGIWRIINTFYWLFVALLEYTDVSYTASQKLGWLVCVPPPLGK